MLDLVQLLSKNSHEEWAKSKMEHGWRYGPIDKDSDKISSLLVPYEFLSDEEKLSSQLNAIETVKGICVLGYSIVDNDISINKPIVKEMNDYESLKENMMKMDEIKNILFNLYLLRACRNDQVNIINSLLQSESKIYAKINIQDVYGHTPLYLAVKHGNYATAELLLKNHANVELFDRNGMTPLMLAAFLGDYRICELLLNNNAKLLVKDVNGYTAMYINIILFRHHACANGHDRVLELLLSGKYIDINHLCYIPEMNNDKNKTKIEENNSTKVYPLESNDSLLEKRSNISGKSSISNIQLFHKKTDNLTIITNLSNTNSPVQTPKVSTPKVSTPLYYKRTFHVENMNNSMKFKNNNDSSIIISPTKQSFDNSHNKISKGGILKYSISKDDDNQLKTNPKGKILFREISKKIIKDKNENLKQSSTRTNKVTSTFIKSLLKKSSVQLIESKKKSAFLEFDPPIISEDFCEYSPLSLAVKTTKIDTIKVLLKYDANPIMKDGTGISPYSRSLIKQATAITYQKIIAEKEQKKIKDVSDKKKEDITPRKALKFSYEERKIKTKYKNDKNHIKIKDKWELTIAKNIEDRINDEQIPPIKQTCELVNLLAESEYVKKKRSSFGLKRFFIEGTVFLFLYILLLAFTPSSLGYNSDKVYYLIYRKYLLLI